VRVAVVVGGRSDEAAVTRVSGENVAQALRRLGHEPVTVEVASTGWSTDRGPVAVAPGRGLADCDVAFPLVAGLQSLLEILDVPYVGPGTLAAGLTGHKKICKDLLGSWGFPQVRYLQWAPAMVTSDLEHLGLPLFVKPARLGSSIGITKVEALGDVGQAVEIAAAHDPLVVIEEAVVDAVELEVGVLGFDKPISSEVGSVIVPPGGWNDYDNKYGAGLARLSVPAEIPDAVAGQAREMAEKCYRMLGCSGGARVDLFYLPDSGRLLVNEVNSSPMYTPTSAFPLLWEASGRQLPEVVTALLDAAFDRYRSVAAEKY
jgi:D-alanine-D-alanine ligase